MKNTLRLSWPFLVLFASSVLYVSCKKEASAGSDGQQQVRVFLTDDPAAFEAVNVDIRTVEVWTVPDSCKNRDDDHDDHGGHSGSDDHGDHSGSDDHGDHDNSCGGWDTLEIRSGVYNLLTLSNGTDTLLASGFTATGTIKKIRITLGDNNSVVFDGVSYPLTVVNGHHQIVIQSKGDDVDILSGGRRQLWLDFDAGRSIIRLRHNQFVLQPRINMFTPARTAGIEGRVQPAEAGAIVSAIAGTDTLTAFPKKDGSFRIRGISAASADLFINATKGGYADTTLHAVSLHAGKETNVGTIGLHK